MKQIDEIIEAVIVKEGDYVYHPDDKGGPTRFGITQAVARKNGYSGDMRNFPINTARSIYYHDYVVQPGFHDILLLSRKITEELVDTGVNMGPGTAIKFLQRALNSLTESGVEIDGKMGKQTLTALKEYLIHRKYKGEDVLVRMLESFQGTRYVELTEANPKQKAFIYGWFLNRVTL